MSFHIKFEIRFIEIDIVHDILVAGLCDKAARSVERSDLNSLNVNSAKLNLGSLLGYCRHVIML